MSNFTKKQLEAIEAVDKALSHTKKVGLSIICDHDFLNYMKFRDRRRKDAIDEDEMLDRKRSGDTAEYVELPRVRSAVVIQHENDPSLYVKKE